LACFFFFRTIQDQPKTKNKPEQEEIEEIYASIQTKVSSIFFFFFFFFFSFSAKQSPREVEDEAQRALVQEKKKGTYWMSSFSHLGP
jgi:hypothetical protein